MEEASWPWSLSPNDVVDDDKMIQSFLGKFTAIYTSDKGHLHH